MDVCHGESTEHQHPVQDRNLLASYFLLPSPTPEEPETPEGEREERVERGTVLSVPFRVPRNQAWPWQGGRAKVGFKLAGTGLEFLRI